MGTFSFSLRWLLFGQSLFSSSGAFSASGVWCFCLVTFFNLDFALRLAYHIHTPTLFLLLPFGYLSIYLSIHPSVRPLLTHLSTSSLLASLPPLSTSFFPSSLLHPFLPPLPVSLSPPPSQPILSQPPHSTPKTTQIQLQTQIQI